MAVLAVIMCVCVFGMVACSNTTDNNDTNADLDNGSTDSDSDNDSDKDDTTAQVYTATGYGVNLWHYNVYFTAYVTVTVQNDIITAISLEYDRGTWMTDGSYAGFADDIRQDYLDSFVGLSATDVLDCTVLPAQDITDHYDGGVIDGSIVGVSGATASSTVIALAVQNAISKMEAYS